MTHMAWAVSLALLSALSIVDASAGQTGERIDASALRAAVERLAAREDARYAEGAIARARGALREAELADDPEATGRSLDVARAAIVLAERRLDLRRIQVELIETQRRLTATRARAEAQRRALEALMKERAALAREGAP
jgi:hypothetical protein